jgi:hypothetical protein
MSMCVFQSSGFKGEDGEILDRGFTVLVVEEVFREDVR